MTESRRPDLPEPLMEALLSLLDVVILERFPGGAFRQVGTQAPPEWFAEAFRDADAAGPVTLVEAFPVLDPFLSEAEVFWKSTAFGRLEGDTFVVGGPGGQNLPLACTAASLSGRAFLLIQRIRGFEDRQQILQRARDQALVQERLVKQLDELRRPFEKLSRCARELAATEGLTPAQRALIVGMDHETGSIGRILESLPKLPPAATPRRR